MRIARAGATYHVAAHEEFFKNQPADFRPVGIAFGADGASLYICDWQHRDTKENVVVGRLWKATYTGANRATPKPAWYLAAAMGQPFQLLPARGPVTPSSTSATGGSSRSRRRPCGSRRPRHTRTRYGMLTAR